jgi:hypothetical protein
VVPVVSTVLSETNVVPDLAQILKLLIKYHYYYYYYYYYSYVGDQDVLSIVVWLPVPALLLDYIFLHSASCIANVRL